MTTPPAIAYLLLRLGQAYEVNAADRRAAKTPEEHAFVNGQRELLNAFGAWIEIAAAGKRIGTRQGRIG
jgi:hypothetical protein